MPLTAPSPEREALDRALRGVLDDLRRAPDDALPAVFERALRLAEANPRVARAGRVLHTSSQAALRALLRRGTSAPVAAHLDALEALGERHPARYAYAAGLAVAAQGSAALDSRAREGLAERAAALRERYAGDATVLVHWSSVVEALSAGDPEAMVPVCAALAEARARRPWDVALLKRWAAALAARVDRLRVKKQWAPIPALRDELAAAMDGEPHGRRVAFEVAKATRDVMYVWEDAEDVAAVERELARLVALREQADGRRDPARSLFAEQWVWGAKVLVTTCDAASWRWGASAVEWLPAADELLGRAAETLEAMWTEVMRKASPRKVDLLAAAIQDHAWCVRQARDRASEAHWHERLTQLARRFPGSSAPREWAHSAGSRALSLAEDGEVAEVLALTAAIEAAAAQRKGDASIREAHAKGVAASAAALRKSGALEEATARVEALAAMATTYQGEPMLVRLFALAAKELAAHEVGVGRAREAEGVLQRMEEVVSLPQGEGLGRRVYAQALEATVTAAQGIAPELAAAARRRLRALAASNPREKAISETLRRVPPAPKRRG